MMRLGKRKSQIKNQSFYRCCFFNLKKIGKKKKPRIEAQDSFVQNKNWISSVLSVESFHLCSPVIKDEVVDLIERVEGAGCYREVC